MMHGRRIAAIAVSTMAGTLVLGGPAGAQAASVDATCDTLQAQLDGDASTIRLMERDCDRAADVDADADAGARASAGPGQPYEVVRDVTIVAGVAGAGFKPTGQYRSLVMANSKDVTLDGLRFEGQDFDGEGTPSQDEGGGGAAYVPLDVRDEDEQPGTLDVLRTTFDGVANRVPARGDVENVAPIDEGYSGGAGGGLYAEPQWGYPSGAVSITDSVFTDNWTDEEGGGAAIVAGVLDTRTARADESPAARVGISGTTFDGNVAGLIGGGGGGGLAVMGELPSRGEISFRARRDTATGNDPFVEPEVALADNDYTGNSASSGGQDGGGALLASVHATSTSERYLANGAGSFATGGGVAVISRSQYGFAPNSREIARASLTAVNSVFAGNQVREPGNGAGIGTDRNGPGCDTGDEAPRIDAAAEATCGSTLDLTHVTVTGNVNEGGQIGAGIGLRAETDVLRADASIIAGNRHATPNARSDAASSVQVHAYGPDADERVSITRSAWCEPGSSAPDPATGNTCAAPLLVSPEGDEETDALPDVHQLVGSPTIDAVFDRAAGRAAAGAATDYEGDPRRLGLRPDMGADEFKPTPPGEQGQEQEEAQQQQTPGSTPGGGQVLGQSSTGTAAPRCSSRRFFRIVLRRNRGPYKSARMWVNGTRVKVTRFKGRPSTRIDLRRFSRQVITVRITAVRANGQTIKGKRIYNPCRLGLDNGRPPKL